MTVQCHLVMYIEKNVKYISAHTRMIHKGEYETHACNHPFPQRFERGYEKARSLDR